MTVGETLQWGTRYLQEHGICEAATDAWLLLEDCCGMTRTRYLLERTRPMEEELLARYRKLLERRGARIPLQHITGHQDFMGLTFLVNDQVLVPRQDTEILVEAALEKARPGMRVLDLCTGSGCIAVSLLKLCPGLWGTATDLSLSALQVARENARRQGIREKESESGTEPGTLEFLQSDLLEQVRDVYDLIVSNPPYIPTGEIEKLEEEVRLHDPWMALDGKEDGLYFYREIAGQCGAYLRPGGWLLLEIGSDQGEAVSALLRENHFSKIEVRKDLAGWDRVVLGRKNETEEEHV